MKKKKNIFIKGFFSIFVYNNIENKTYIQGDKMKSNKKEKGLYIRLTEKEEEIVRRAKKDYSVNMSQYLRNQIVKLDERLKSNLGGEL